MTGEADSDLGAGRALDDGDEHEPDEREEGGELDATIDEISAQFDALGDSPSIDEVTRRREEAQRAEEAALRSPAAVAEPAPIPEPASILEPEKILEGPRVPASPRLAARVQRALAEVDLVVASGKVTRASGIIVEATLPRVAVGTACVILVGEGRLISAEVVGFSRSKALMMPFGELAGIGEGCAVGPRASAAEVPVGDALLGRVVDAAMRPADGKPAPSLNKTAVLNAPPPPAMQRRRIARPLVLGIRSLDACLTCGEGQRVGIMAGPGVGKSVLLGMLARSASADIIVCALVGERGREVREFVERDLGPAGLARSVVVVATADEPPLVRVRAAKAATSVAEYFRARGKKVLLLVDSLSRVAMAQREIGLAAGEPPTSRGYPPSVFAALPRLVERAGNSVGEGSITAMYTVLAEGDDMTDPVTDARRAPRSTASSWSCRASWPTAATSRRSMCFGQREPRDVRRGHTGSPAAGDGSARGAVDLYIASRKADLIEQSVRYVAGSNPRRRP